MFAARSPRTSVGSGPGSSGWRGRPDASGTWAADYPGSACRPAGRCRRGESRQRVGDGLDRRAPSSGYRLLFRARACGTFATPRWGRRPSRRSPAGLSPPTRHLGSIAQSSEDGPRSPLMPGCTIRQRCLRHTDSGMIALSIGRTISSGVWRATAARSPARVQTSTETAWPRSVRATKTRWLRLLWAETRKRIRSGRSARGAGAASRLGLADVATLVMGSAVVAGRRRFCGDEPGGASRDTSRSSSEHREREVRSQSESGAPRLLPHSSARGPSPSRRRSGNGPRRPDRRRTNGWRLTEHLRAREVLRCTTGRRVWCLYLQARERGTRRASASPSRAGEVHITH